MQPLPRPARCSRARTRSAHVLQALALASFLVHLSASPAAQCSGLPFHEGNFVCSPAALTGDYRGIVSGDLSGDWSPEIATLKGQNLIIYHDADVGNDAVLVAEDAIDLCFASQSDDQGRPGIFYTTPNGLFCVQFDPADLKYFTIEVDSSSLWKGATRIRASTGVGGGPREGLIGVDSEGRGYFRAVPESGGFAEPEWLFQLGATQTTLDVALLNYDGPTTGPVEIGILHSGGVQVRGQDATVLLTRVGIIPGDAIAAVRVPNRTDSLAWITRLPSGWSNLLLFNHAFTTYQGPLPISSRQFTSMAAADLDGDGDDDLVLGARYWDELQVLPCDPTASNWFSGTPATVHMSLDGTAHQVGAMGPVLSANLFNDWNANEVAVPAFAIALPEQDGMRLMPQLAARAQQSLSANDFDDASYTSACHTTTDQSLWGLTLGGGWGLINATHVEMIVYKCDSNLEVPDQDPFYPSTRLELDEPNHVAGQHLYFSGLETAALEALPVRYFVAVRPVRVLNEQVVKVWRWSILSMGTTCESFLWLLGLPGAVEQPLVTLTPSTCLSFPDLCDTGEGGGSLEPFTRYVPSAVPQSRIPNHGGVLPGTGPGQ